MLLFSKKISLINRIKEKEPDLYVRLRNVVIIGYNLSENFIFEIYNFIGQKERELIFYKNYKEFSQIEKENSSGKLFEINIFAKGYDNFEIFVLKNKKWIIKNLWDLKEIMSQGKFYNINFDLKTSFCKNEKKNFKIF